MTAKTQAKPLPLLILKHWMFELYDTLNHEQFIKMALTLGSVWMVDDDGPWYDGLIEEFDREHHARAIENFKHVVAMRMRGHGANDFPYDVRYEPYIARLDATGNSAFLMYLELLRDWDTQYSWGSAALAYLYHQSDQASTRTKDTSSLCGFVWSLSVWMWDRLSVGLPVIKKPHNPNPNPHEVIHDQDPYRRPTIAYCWHHVFVYTGSSHVRYKCYVNEMDTLTVEQVRCPMIFFYAVEWHFVDSVARKFGKLQGIPIEESKETITKLHRFSRSNN
ncbi:hypothetical protein D1007_12251 [Hordeum vulgare]|nr:hypothetical protein D1007_12251 [Hordeum vulgare]